MSEQPACYAVTESQSRQRRYTEKPHPYRLAFERDRDRIMHSAAFRRLEGKTQVFMPGINDHYRTRLTHSIEVAQIGRTIARVLKLNESLTEAICLGHDLGHSPFGHTGEKVLNDLMGRFGGFEHNQQALRIVDMLEHPYADFRGLNLMYETRLGFARHHSPYDNPTGGEFAERYCSLEGQIADVADRIAYNCHDLEDGLRGGLIEQEQLKEIELFADARQQINAESIDDETARRARTANSIMDRLVSDVIDTSTEAVEKAQVRSPSDVYSYPDKLIRLSDNADKKLAELEAFLLKDLYMHKVLVAAHKNVESGLSELFEKLCAKVELLPEYYRQLIEPESLERTVCDYIAGMTDRYCLSMLEDLN